MCLDTSIRKKSRVHSRDFPLSVLLITLVGIIFYGEDHPSHREVYEQNHPPAKSIYAPRLHAHCSVYRVWKISLSVQPIVYVEDS